MLRSKALTRLDGRQTTSARRLNKATRARDGAGALGSGDGDGAGSLTASPMVDHAG